MTRELHPSHFVGALITCPAGTLIGVASIGVIIEHEPTNLDEVKLLGERLTRLAQEQDGLPSTHRYTVLSWQRFSQSDDNRDGVR